jgi:tRNA C32,U32 (ribose-2'-O)-methylase TrmJ
MNSVALWFAKLQSNSRSEILPCGVEEDELMQLTCDLMDKANFSRSYNRDLVALQLRSALQKMRPNKREFDLLRGFLLRLNDKLSKCEK